MIFFDDFDEEVANSNGDEDELIGSDDGEVINSDVTDLTEEENDLSEEKSFDSSSSKIENESKEEQISNYRKKIDELECEVKKLTEFNLRLRAEFDNFKRRTAKEKQGLYGSAQVDCISEFLPVFDGLERAFDLTSSQNDDLSQGVRLIFDQFLNVLKKLGVKSVAQKGELFDPKFHSAVKTVEVEGEGKNVIYEVLQKGYCKGENVVRHAMVVVANP